MGELKTLDLEQDLKDTLEDRLERSIAEANSLFLHKISSLWGEKNLELILDELERYNEPVDKVVYELDEKFKQFTKKISLNELSNNNEELANHIIYLIRRSYKSIHMGGIHVKRFRNSITFEDLNIFITNIQLVFYLLGCLDTIVETNKISASLLNKIASKGGFAKAEKYREKMNPIFEEVFILFTQINPKTGNRWNSKKECVNFYIKDFYKKNPNTEIDLDPKKLVQEITIRLSDLSASRRVNMLVK
ncbi:MULTISPECIES: hypothetical protein [unclassified Acinetobacter]|uniref:hypothetical protein n=1 Tax=unclassified Acinetobacter TaxID=196816 RepID=UPI00244AF6AB|nr:MULTISPECIES: hypothetical protein [unclassified Acinetobacter]MDH0030933.1 hypothetical protein [Acinetobacter sp. GD04021]MDH0886505.1 hypothetical protein [Acinetobacter sp. GD03873]MDH1083057.1 hypothetical protein [Acinetobacter sp. GD03983]MDH2189982.1 hypothetical protein [Acinetobacter sp. GD03645]MDH2203236.1 hypothetical protein [Acinetobacter sp. GD03647]